MWSHFQPWIPHLYRAACFFVAERIIQIVGLLHVLHRRHCLIKLGLKLDILVESERLRFLKVLRKLLGSWKRRFLYGCHKFFKSWWSHIRTQNFLAILNLMMFAARSDLLRSPVKMAVGWFRYSPFWWRWLLSCALMLKQKSWDLVIQVLTRRAWVLKMTSVLCDDWLARGGSSSIFSFFARSSAIVFVVSFEHH